MPRRVRPEEPVLPGLEDLRAPDQPPEQLRDLPLAVPGPAVHGPAVPGPAVPGPAVPGPAVPGPAVPPLPAVRLRPARELAPRARDAPLLRQAAALARWSVGAHLTQRGALRAKDARAAAAALGLGMGDRSRGAEQQGVPLERLWETAVDAELVGVEDRGTGRYAVPRPGLEVLEAADDGSSGAADDLELLGVWCDLLVAVAASSPVAISALLELHLRAPVPVADLGADVQGSPLWPDSLDGPLGAVLARTVGEMVAALLVELEALGVVQGSADGVRLSELGLLGASELFRVAGLEAPTVEDLASADAAALLGLGLRCQDDGERAALLAEWAGAKGPSVAARELVDHAAAADPAERAEAFGALMGIDVTAAEPALRSALEVPSLLPFATAWLASHGLDGPAPTAGTAAWLVVDTLAAQLEMVEAGDRAQLRTVLRTVLAGVGSVDEQVAVVGTMAESGHPAAGEVLEAIRSHHPQRRVARAAGPAPRSPRGRTPARPAAAYQLKITLQDVRPPVWRRVVVPGSFSLAQLHQVVQVAMGWGDSHLHEFEVDGVRYGLPEQGAFAFGEPRCPEGRVRLDEVARTGTRISYTYDFGDDWLHAVVVEDVRPPEPGEQLPACLAGRRACPPEDVGGSFGYEELLAAYQDPAHPDHEHYREWAGPDLDPAKFDRDATTAVLRRLR